jgi:hypothetical protein
VPDDKSAERNRRRDLLLVIGALEALGEASGWRGTDPYDGLNASRGVAFLQRSPLGRRILTQAVKRSAVNVRPLLGISPERSSAAIAHVLAAYARTRIHDTERRIHKMDELIGLLERGRCEGYREFCWGYHFDVQTRVFFYPRGAPNTIATAFAGLALLDAYECGAGVRALEMAQSAADYFIAHVPQTQTSDGAYFGYLSGDGTPIHNANILACSLLARVGALTNSSVYTAAATSGVAYTIARQRHDGAWLYGEAPHLAWIDNFHTGYVLEGLATCSAAGVAVSEHALARGLAFYRSELFLDDGTPKYRPDGIYPIDSQCVAQGIQTFAGASAQAAYPEFAWQIFDFAMQKMRRRDGAFIFQRRRFWTNRQPHVRWTTAPMFLALAHLEVASVSH